MRLALKIFCYILEDCRVFYYKNILSIYMRSVWVQVLILECWRSGGRGKDEELINLSTHLCKVKIAKLPNIKATVKKHTKIQNLPINYNLILKE